MITFGDVGLGFMEQISSNLIVDAGNGTDELTIYDEQDDQPKDIELKFNNLLGLDGQDFRNTSNYTDIFYFKVEELSLYLGGADGVAVEILSTGQDSITNVHSQGGAQFVNVTSTQGDLNVFLGEGKDEIMVHTTANFTSLFIDAGADDDLITIYGLGYQSTASVHGGGGEDQLYVDPRSSTEGMGRNKMNDTTLSWNGGGDNDFLEMHFASTGFTDLDITDDNEGTNEAIVHCPDIACTVLSRDTFLANIHDPGNPNGSLERLNMKNDATITSLLLFLHEGNNR